MDGQGAALGRDLVQGGGDARDEVGGWEGDVERGEEGGDVGVDPGFRGVRDASEGEEGGWGEEGEEVGRG